MIWITFTVHQVITTARSISSRSKIISAAFTRIARPLFNHVCSQSESAAHMVRYRGLSLNAAFINPWFIKLKAPLKKCGRDLIKTKTHSPLQYKEHSCWLQLFQTLLQQLHFTLPFLVKVCNCFQHTGMLSGCWWATAVGAGHTAFGAAWVTIRGIFHLICSFLRISLPPWTAV